MAELTHINEQGRAKMVDVSEKADTKRIGVASGRICMQPETFALITDGKIKKGRSSSSLLYYAVWWCQRRNFFVIESQLQPWGCNRICGRK